MIVLAGEEASINGDQSIIGNEKEEYKTLRSFFTYANYNNIHEFYESYQHHRCEKKI